jgi:Reverse transcriptase (RNA-dependent DNA polymerase)
LPGESTQEPIYLLNNICEEAREENKELWILLQDTAKAYDTVSLAMLEKAMLRIRIPAKIISLLLEPFSKRVTRVITDIGLTKEIIAGDGIDQGETISPLLWRIFYDPLLCEIQENKKLGYNMSCTWSTDFSKSIDRKDTFKTLSIRQAAIVYMDDTTWIAKSKQDMNLILERAKWFYAANDSQINSRKSVLITINSKNNEPNKINMGINQEEVIELNRKQHSRFLGIWLGSKDHSKDTVQRIQQEIKSVLTILKKKRITDKHVEYILNRVLIPRIEYRAQHCALNAITAHNLSAQLRTVLKQAANISKTIPNSVTHHKSLYKLKSIKEIQLENQITNLTNLLNNNKHPSVSTIIRLKQAQIKQWEPANILVENTRQSPPKKNLSAAILKTANEIGITYPDSQWKETFQWKGGSFSIKTLLNNQTRYNQATKSLRKHNIMYIDQIIEKESGILLDWKFIQLSTNRGRGPKPTWYSTI